MIDVLELQDENLKRFVDSVYIFRSDGDALEFTAYPTTNTPVGLFRGASVTLEGKSVTIDRSAEPDYFAVACNQFYSGLHLRYLNAVDEIAINFKPLGLAAFSGTLLRDEKNMRIDAWDDSLPALFNEVFSAGDRTQQLQYIEAFLRSRYMPLDDEEALLTALGLLNDPSGQYNMQEIAAAAGMHYKHLYRRFRQTVGCSMAHYRKLVKFRSSVVSKLITGGSSRLVDVCYANGYADQAHFIREYRRLTGEKPTRFFKDLSAFGTDKVIFRMD